MPRLAIAARIYAVLIRRSPRDFVAANDTAAHRDALASLAGAALAMADVLIDADARSAPPTVALAEDTKRARAN